MIVDSKIQVKNVICIGNKEKYKDCPIQRMAAEFLNSPVTEGENKYFFVEQVHAVTDDMLTPAECG